MTRLLSKFTHLLPLLLPLLPTLTHTAEIIQLHGSGTTNPSKCYWLIMQQIMDRSKIPLRLTYRAVGSSTGQKEFMGTNNTGDYRYVPYNDFGSGDIPVSTADYESLNRNGKEFVHLPIVLGAISFFHSVPGVADGELNMTSCLLAKIFKREITYWDDNEILVINPGMAEKLPSSMYPINVARRVQGSSSTASITQYLHTSCPTEWPENLVGKVIDWPEDTLPCEGSGGMTACIVDTPGTIGYIDSGHGHDEGLVEIDLKNKFGTYLSSKEAAAQGGIGAAAVSVPGRADADFGSVNLLNQDGKYTWPIVAMSYIYARKDLSHMDSDTEKTLLKYFLSSLYDPDYINQCSQFGFTPVPETVRSIGLEGIAMIEDGGDAPVWTTEVATTAGEGMGDYVISVKRRTYSEYVSAGNTDDIDTINAQMEAAEIERAVYTTTGATAEESGDGPVYTADTQKDLQTALIMGAVSIALWSVTIATLLVKKILMV